MRLLLDTHTFLWWLDGDRRLSPSARRHIADERHVILISAVSAWEITTKARLGKLPGALDVASDVAGAAASQGFSALDISILHAQRAGRLPGDHRDPFDRMLIAQAHLEDVPIVSNETVFDAYGVNRIW